MFENLRNTTTFQVIYIRGPVVRTSDRKGTALCESCLCNKGLGLIGWSVQQKRPNKGHILIVVQVKTILQVVGDQIFAIWRYVARPAELLLAVIFRGCIASSHAIGQGLDPFGV